MEKEEPWDNAEIVSRRGATTGRCAVETDEAIAGTIPTKIVFFILCSVVSFFCASATDPDTKDRTQQTIPIHSTAMFSSAIRDTMVIDVSLPASYEVNTAARYPALYLSDGYWRRGQHQPIHDMVRNENVKEVIIVGIGYPDSYDPNVIRVRDLINDPGRYLDFILHQLIPYIEKNYRTSGEKTLWGASYGGYFAMCVLFNYYTNTKEVFRNYVVSGARTPALWTDAKLSKSIQSNDHD